MILVLSLMTHGAIMTAAKDTVIQDYIRIGAVYESYVSFEFLQEWIESCNLS